MPPTSPQVGLGSRNSVGPPHHIGQHRPWLPLPQCHCPKFVNVIEEHLSLVGIAVVPPCSHHNYQREAPRSDSGPVPCAPPIQLRFAKAC